MGRVPDPMPELAALYLDPRTRQIAPEWYKWLTLIRTLVGAAPQTVGTGSLTSQSASIPTTNVQMPALVGGVYRLNLYLRELQGAGGNSNLTATVGWTEAGTALSWTSAALVGNNKTTLLTQTLLVRADANTPITYSTTYSSSGSPSMTYEVALLVEQM
jgi:hypothetical protein